MLNYFFHKQVNRVRKTSYRATSGISRFKEIKGTGSSIFLLFSAKRLKKKVGSFFGAKRLKKKLGHFLVQKD
jgi:hypothetical protein